MVKLSIESQCQTLNISIHDNDFSGMHIRIIATQLDFIIYAYSLTVIVCKLCKIVECDLIYNTG